MSEMPLTINVAQCERITKLIEAVCGPMPGHTHKDYRLATIVGHGRDSGGNPVLGWLTVSIMGVEYKLSDSGKVIG